MAVTYDPIATTTLGSAASSITFSSISSSYTDLKVVLQFAPSNDDRAICTFNSDTGTNYSVTTLVGNGSTVSSAQNTSANYIQPSRNAGAANEEQLVIMDIFSYAGSKNKTVLSDVAADRNGAGVTVKSVNLWRSTSAINAINFTLVNGNNYKIGTTATLYGIKNA
jgi:pantothenate kinase